MLFDLAIILTSVIAGSVAAISGFGIGSLLTPVLSLGLDTKLAIALASIPHFVATAIRFWLLRAHLDRKVLLSFGLMSAAGGLAGALLHARFAAPAVGLVFGLILVFAGGMGMTGWAQKLRLRGAAAWIAGGVSGALGGMVGNQGGIRSAALLSFPLTKRSFVATATAIGVIVDTARMPVYFWSEGTQILEHGHWVALATGGVVLGTAIGTRVLRYLPEDLFRRVVSGLIFALGIFMLMRALFPSALQPL